MWSSASYVETIGILFNCGSGLNSNIHRLIIRNTLGIICEDNFGRKTVLNKELIALFTLLRSAF